MTPARRLHVVAILSACITFVVALTAWRLWPQLGDWAVQRAILEGTKPPQWWPKSWHVDYIERKAAADYRIVLQTEQADALDLRSTPVLRFRDISTRTAVPSEVRGRVFLWTRKGCPAAYAEMWDWNGYQFHFFQSLTSTGLIAQRNGDEVWKPSTGELDFAIVAGSPEVAHSPEQRLTQMQKMAREFAGTVHGGSTYQGGQIELQLVQDAGGLPEPIYRYCDRETGLLDGCLFVFAKGTNNPEILMILEARDSGGTFAWHSAFARSTARACEVQHRGRTVWTAPLIEWPSQWIEPPTESCFELMLQGDKRVR
jgi:hypothetical protein